MKITIDKVHPDIIVHLGDHIVDAILLQSKYPNLLFEMVNGNCDQNNNHPTKKTTKINSLVMFITHGDTYQVNYGIDEIAEVGKSEYANIILHGHTHKPSLSSVQGVTIMNPGRIGRISSKKAMLLMVLLKQKQVISAAISASMILWRMAAFKHVN